MPGTTSISLSAPIDAAINRHGRVDRLVLGFTSAIVAHSLLVLLVAIAAFRGLIYVTILPPWDINDEEQHFHYVQYLAGEHQLPIMGVTYLSPEILASASDTSRWEHFHFPRPQTIDAQRTGLEGYSYEAYQPPVYYAVLTLPFLLSQAVASYDGTAQLGPNEALAVLYALRIFSVALSSVTVLLAYMVFRSLFPTRRDVAATATLVLTLIPERTLTNSRVNNDVLLELSSTLVLLLLLRLGSNLLTPKRALVLGILLSVAILSKLSAIVLVPLALFVVLLQAIGARNPRYFISRASIILGIEAVCTGWFFVRNILLYGDVSGAASFVKLIDFGNKFLPFDLVWGLLRSIWMTRWNGIVPDSLRIFMMLVGFLALAGLIVRLCRIRERKSSEERINVNRIIVLICAAIIWPLPLLWGIWTGVIPYTGGYADGRFLSPAYVPAISLLFLGISYLPSSMLFRIVVISIGFALAFADAAYLLGFSLPYYYGESVDFAQFFARKPAFINELLIISALGYLAAVIIFCFQLLGLRFAHKRDIG